MRVCEPDYPLGHDPLDVRERRTGSRRYVFAGWTGARSARAADDDPADHAGHLVRRAEVVVDSLNREHDLEASAPVRGYRRNVTTVAELCAREKCSIRQVNMTISLAFLAPNLVKAAVEGRLPRGIGIERLRDPPTEWSRQFEALGLNPE